MKLDHEWFVWTYIDTFKADRGSVHTLQNESNVNPLHLQRLWFWELMTTAMFIITYNNKTPQSLNQRHLVFPAPEADSSQLTQGGPNVRRSCQSTIVGGACAELHHSDRTRRTAWFEKRDFKIGIKKKNTEWVFIIIRWMCTHTSNSHLCSNNW